MSGLEHRSSGALATDDLLQRARRAGLSNVSTAGPQAPPQSPPQEESYDPDSQDAVEGRLLLRDAALQQVHRRAVAGLARPSTVP